MQDVQAIRATRVMKELWDLEACEQLLKTKYFHRELPAMKRSLEEMIAIAKHNGGFIEVEYGFNGYNASCAGRYKTQVRNGSKLTNQICFVAMKREFRAYIAKKNYLDIDMVNCHPIIIKQLNAGWGVKAETFDYYVDNRDQCLLEIMDMGCSKEIAKELILRLTFGGTIEEWCSEYEKPIDELPEFVFKLKEEISFMIDFYSSQMAFQHIRKYAEERKLANPKKRCVKTSTFSYIVQGYERMIIDHLIAIVESEGHTVGSIIYDGIHIQMCDIVESDLKRWCDKVFDACQFRIKLSVKPFEISPLMYDMNPDIVPTRGYDSDILFNAPDYDTMKQLWETICCKILNTGAFMVFNSEGRVMIKNTTELKDHYLPIKYSVPVEDKSKAITTKELDFIPKWIGDRLLRRCNDIEFSPPPRVPTRGYYNLWNGFHLDVPGSNPDSPAVVEILNYIKDIFTEEYYEYIINWIAQIIQEPAVKPGIALLLYSLQTGTGKSVFASLVGSLVGREYYYYTNKPEASLFGQFNSDAARRFVVNIDEANPAVSFMNGDLIKGLITQEEASIIKKGKDAITLDDYTRYIFTSNSSNALKIDDTNRRVVCFEISPIHKQDSDYFEKINANIIKKEEHMRDVFSYFKRFKRTMDVFKDRPTTSLMESMMKLNTPPIKKWLADYLTETIPVCQIVPGMDVENLPLLRAGTSRVKLMDLWLVYQKWMKEHGYKDVCEKGFRKDMMEIGDKTKSTKIEGIDLSQPKGTWFVKFTVDDELLNVIAGWA